MSGALTDRINGAAPSEATDPFMDLIRTVVARPDVDVEKMSQLLNMLERREKADAIRAFNAALASAKAQVGVIVKNRRVSFASTKGATDYAHEDLAGIANQIDDILAAHGLSYRFRTHQAEASVSVTCIVAHERGHAEETSLTSCVDTSGNKNAIQAIGSAVTYLQRYTLKAALGLAAAKDDDGRSAGRSVNPQPAVTTIDGDQVQQLEDLFAELHDRGVTFNVAGFCRYFKINKYSDLPVDRYAEAVSLLNKKRDAA